MLATNKKKKKKKNTAGSIQSHMELLGQSCTKVRSSNMVFHFGLSYFVFLIHYMYIHSQEGYLTLMVHKKSVNINTRITEHF